jgi:HK97 family phage prohead protease
MSKKLSKIYAPLELKDVSENDGYGYFEGYASVFNYLDSDNDIVLRGAFVDSISVYPNVKMLWQHNPSMPIGKYPEIREDENGLYVKGQINLQVEKGKEAYALVKQGALDSMSIGYRTKECEYDSTKSVRKIKKLDLYEVSLVTFPANDRATINGVKSAYVEPEDNLLETIGTVREFERLLRDELGCSWKQASHIAKYGFKNADDLRDEVAEVSKDTALIKALASFKA